MMGVSDSAGQRIGFLEHFVNLKDPRQLNKAIYPLEEILLLVLCAVLSGADDWVAIALFGEQRLKFLRRFLPFENGTPSHDQLGNVFAAIDEKQFQQCFADWVSSVHGTLKGVVAIDGKTLRRSFDKAGKKGAIHMVSAWCSEHNPVLAQSKVNEKSNEITAIPQLLDLLQLKGAIVTIDAMGCQREIAQKIVDKQAHYIFSLKGNQTNLHADIKRFFIRSTKTNPKGITVACHDKVEKSHGRTECRKITVCGDVEWLHKRHKWPSLASIIRVQYSSKDKNRKTRQEIRYYISSLAAEAEFMANAIRDHWGIENALHWVMDMVFRDDECRIRKKNAPANFVTIKHIASNLLRSSKGKTSMRQKRHKAAWNEDYLFELITT